MDQPGLNTPTQGQRPTATITGPNKTSNDQLMKLIQTLPNKVCMILSQVASSPSTSKRSRKRPINEIRPSIFSQVSGSTNEDSSSAPKRDRKQPIDQPIPSTSRQDQQQPMIHNESSNTSSNQATVLSQKYQRSFNRIKQRLVESKKIAKEKREKYCKHADLKFSQQLALAMGKEISEPRHNPDTEKKLKQEYEKASRRVYSIRHDLKVFMERHGLRFEEPDSD
ncbi:hypothetical protein BDEG_27136 [Batrachochytrium dendrobatidis JEL423]|uniref:Uncharacterized protein n=1 Tax=Batrachochytrium dendrobatidis (strain JEL423) TaxID=403673 RepID=A0A177WUR4_BATDL|nr:hypothetical protein BDEG_27136 [Batrachochytrium dendrobatidis JEL423]